MPKLYPRSMTAGVRTEVSDLGYRGQDFRLKNRGQVYLLLTFNILRIIGVKSSLYSFQNIPKKSGSNPKY